MVLDVLEIYEKLREEGQESLNSERMDLKEHRNLKDKFHRLSLARESYGRMYLELSPLKPGFP